MSAPRRNHRAEARDSIGRFGSKGPVGAARELPLCGHTDVWSWDETTPLVCSLCHPKPGSKPVPASHPAPASHNPVANPRPLSPSPWRHEYQDQPSAGRGSRA